MGCFTNPGACYATILFMFSITYETFCNKTCILFFRISFYSPEVGERERKREGGREGRREGGREGGREGREGGTESAGFPEKNIFEYVIMQ